MDSEAGGDDYDGCMLGVQRITVIKGSKVTVRKCYTST